MLPSDASAPQWLRDRGNRMVTAGIVLALLYVGRDVLVPLALAIMLSFLMAPVVRALRRMGVGHTPSVLMAVLVLTVSCMAVAMVLGIQTLRLAESLPRYEATVQSKLKTLDEVTVGRLRLLTNEASRLFEIHRDATEPILGSAGDLEHAVPTRPPGVVVLQSREAMPQPLQLVGKLLSSVWVPLQATGIVLLVLIFALLEHESLRDRFIRMAGAADIQSTTLALNDAGARLSRFFVSQFAVNLVFALAVGVSLGILHLPQATLLGALAGVMRFVPYVGVGIAALFTTALALAVDPGWSLAVETLGVFILFDMIAGQLLEPHLYGHAAGLSPLAVVVGAIFWSWLWGPMGLILSTPLTVCLVVAGQHIKGLGMLELLLSDAQALTLPQRFYQRALSADPLEIIASAREYLRRDSLAAYCDSVLIPALHLDRLDADAGRTSEEQHKRIGRVIIDVVAALSSQSLKLPRMPHRGSVLEDTSAGRWLREEREQLSGKWQGALGAPPGSVVICVGLGSSADDLVAELLVRLLRAEKIDARHFSPADMVAGLPPGADPEGVSILYLASAFPGPERERADMIGKQARELFPSALMVKILCPGVTAPAERGESAGNADHVVVSLVQAIEICLTRQTRVTDRPTKPS